MTNGEAVIWLINIAADIGKAEHRDLWHYEQALCEIREMLESAQPEYYDYSDIDDAWEYYAEEQDIKLTDSAKQLKDAMWVGYRKGKQDAQPETSILTVTVAPDSEEIERVVHKIKDAPVMAVLSAEPDVHDRKVGKWIYLTGLDTFECSVCGGHMVRNIFDYCPWCGSKMKGENDGRHDLPSECN